MAACFVYILTNRPRGVLYTGMTVDLVGRISQHREGAVESFAARTRCTQLVWYEPHEDYHTAYQREYLIKRWRRAWKIRLIEEMNPGWKDLWQELVDTR
ncbi:MAG: GIY-YIG nuclease family protein [Oceanicaulis sp.]